MGESTNTLLYTATYVFIFIIAVSLSIVLFLTVNRYADATFEYKQSLDSSIINTGTTGLEESTRGQVILTKDDAFSYYVNYVKKDLYGESGSSSNTKYNVKIIDKNGAQLSNEISYTDAYDRLCLVDKYYIKYISESATDVTIEIRPSVE